MKKENVCSLGSSVNSPLKNKGPTNVIKFHIILNSKKGVRKFLTAFLRPFFYIFERYPEIKTNTGI